MSQTLFSYDCAGELTIRRLMKADLPSLEWDGEYTHFRKLYLDIYRSSHHGSSILWVAELGINGIIGQLFVQLKGKRPELADGIHRAYIYAFRIKNPFRNMGIGSLLMNQAEMDLVERGFSFITLNVAQDNEKARSFYESRGYQIISMEAGRWCYLDHLGLRREVNEPSWRMSKALNISMDG